MERKDLYFFNILRFIGDSGVVDVVFAIPKSLKRVRLRVSLHSFICQCKLITKKTKTTLFTV